MTRARTCTGKVAHATKEQAIAHAVSLRKGWGATGVDAYRCPCGKWHVGHRPRPRRRR